MRLSRRILRSLDAQRVRRINEMYHNLENAGYDERHEDISQFEASFWREVARKYRRPDQPVVWLDYGAGTGFVPLAAREYWRAADQLICCDVSRAMLELCEAKLKDASLPCRCCFAKIDGPTIPAESGSVDVISVNSVLHHLYDLPTFAGECERALKPAGLLIVAHEPNGNTDLPVPGRLLRGLARAVFRPKTVVFALAARSALIERLLRSVTGRVSPRYRRRNQMLADLARQIRHEGLLDFDLRGTEIQQIVDYQSQSGFDPRELFGRIFNQFRVVEFQTYGHLCFFPAGKGPRAVDGYLKKHWPAAGREMCFVLQRTDHSEEGGVPAQEK
jgi:ubiquinone/menaquinone biosynthesis C-methylase UbiE